MPLKSDDHGSFERRRKTSMAFSRLKKVVISVFLIMILFSFTVLQYNGFPLTPDVREPGPKYSIETYAAIGQRQSMLRDTTKSVSLSTNTDDLISGHKAIVTIDSCLGVEEPGDGNVR